MGRPTKYIRQYISVTMRTVPFLPETIIVFIIYGYTDEMCSSTGAEQEKKLRGAN